VRLGQELEERWPKEFGRYEDELKALKQRIDEFRKSVNVKGGNQIEKVERYALAAQDAEQLLRELEQVKQQLAQTLRRAQDDLHLLDEAKSHDLKRIQEKADLLHLDPNEVTELLLGPELTNRLETAIGWAKFIRERIQLATDDPQPVRLRGETIVFPRKQELPLLLVRLLKVDGEGDFNGERLVFDGSISGITTDPKIHGKPIIVRLDAVGHPFQADPNAHPASNGNEIQLTSGQSEKPDLVSVQLEAVLDYTKDVPEHQLKLSYKEPRPNQHDLGNPESFQLAMTSRAANCRANLTLVGDELSGQIDYHQAIDAITAKLGTKRFKGDEIVLAVIQDVVTGIHEIDANMKLSGTALKPQFTLSSNLGRELSDGINTAFAEQLKSGRRDLLVRFDREAAKRSEKLTRLYDEQLQKLTGQLNLNKGEVQEVAQSFGVKLPGKLDIKGITGGLPIDINKPIDPKKPIDLKGLGKALPKLDAKLPKFDEQPETATPPNKPAQKASGAIRQASEIESTLDDLGLFGKKKRPAPKAVQPADSPK
jgi:hypothetical protein